MMKKPTVVIPIQLPLEGFKALESCCNLDYPERHKVTREELKEMLKGAEALVGVFAHRVDADLMRSAPNLKIISNYGVGYNNIDVPFATSRGIIVTNTPLSVLEPTAELAMGLMIAVARRIPECDRKLRSTGAKWSVMENLGTTLHGKVLGVFGMGSIGKALARRARAFGMKIIYHNRHQLDPSIEKPYEAEYVSFDQLLLRSDVLSINAPLNEQTYHRFGIQEFEKMKPGAFLINAARGALVNEEELALAIENKEIAGAGLDVFENEPHVSPRLLQLDQVVCVPHVGTATMDTRIAMAQEVSENLYAFFNGERPKNIVNPEVLRSKE